MARIPTLLSDQSVDAGGTGPSAPSSAFEVDSSGVTQGLGALAGGLRGAAGDFAQVEAQKKQKYDMDYVSQAVEQEKRTMNEWLADPKNHTSTTYATDFLDFAKTRMGEYQLPDNKLGLQARKTLIAHLNDYTTQKYDQALYTTEQNKITDSVDRLGDSISSATASYRAGRAIPNNDAIGDLQKSFETIRENLENSFKDAPKLQGKLKEKLASDFIDATMSDNPAIARHLLDQSTDIDERARRVLNNEIDAAQKHFSSLQQTQFNAQRADVIANTESGKNRDKIPLTSYQKFYPDDHAQALKFHDDAQIDTLVKANDFTTDISDKNPLEQQRAFGELSKSASGAEGQDVLRIVHQKMAANLDLLEKNHVAWLQQNNGEIKMLSQRVTDAIPEDKQAAIKDMVDGILKYQGALPPDAAEVDKVRYLNLPIHDRHIMDNVTAESHAAEINRGTPADAIKAIQRVLGTYTDPQHQIMALNDMVTVPKNGQGLKQEYQLIFQNKDQWWIDDVIAAFQNSKPIAQLTDERRKKIEGLVDADKTWNMLSHSMVGDGFQRSGEIDGFKHGIMAYSQALEAQGMPIEKAVPQAVKKLISTTLGFTSVNGQTLTIPRENGKNPPRDDADVADIGRRLSYSLQYINPQEIDRKNLPFVNQLPDEKSRDQQIRNLITQRGFFQPGPDGQSVSLYLRDDNGSAFQASDRGGQPLIIHFSDLPQFMETTYMPGLPPSMPYAQFNARQIRGEARVTYPMSQIPPGMTNWPMRAPFIKSK